MYYEYKMSVTPINTRDDWLNAITHENGVVMVTFTASWCAPCKKIKPFIDSLATNLEVLQHGFLFVSVDVDALPQVAETLQVNTVPTFVFLYNGKIVEKINGANEEAIHAAINTHYKLPYLKS
jgi:thioredoxin 1